MSRSTRQQRVDDVDGSPAAHTVVFALDGLRYEIDLSDANAAALRDLFAPYVAAGRRAGSKRGLATAKAVVAERSAQPGRKSKSDAARRPAASFGKATAARDEHSTVPSAGEIAREHEPTARAASDSEPGKAREAPLAPVVPLPRRLRAQAGIADMPGQRRRLVEGVGELTRIVAVAMLAATADRLVARFVTTVDAVGAGDRVPNNISDGVESAGPSRASSIAPAG